MYITEDSGPILQFSSVVYRMAQKMTPFFLYALTSSILNDFQNYFIVRIRRKVLIILSLKIPPHLKYVATLPCKMSSVLKATIENKLMHN